MNLPTRVLMLAVVLFFLQLLAAISFFYGNTAPKALNLEKNSVEKNLHRGLEALQRELFYLGRLSQFLAQQNVIQQGLNGQIAQTLLEEKMNYNELNFLYLLNKQNKVMWESAYDLAAEQPYPRQTLLTSLWENKPSFFEHKSTFSLQAGFYNSHLGPLLLVSVPIIDADQQINGTLIVGKIVTLEVLQLLQSITVTDLRLWPLGSEGLNSTQLTIVDKILASDTDFMIQSNQNLLRGYMILQDLNDQPQLLLSTTQTTKFLPLLQKNTGVILLIFIGGQMLFLIALILLLRHTTFYPLHQLMKQLEQSAVKNPHFALNPFACLEMHKLIHALQQFSSRQQSYWERQIRITQQETTQQAYENLENELAEILPPLFNEMTLGEKKLSSLPIQELAEIIAQNKTGRINYNKFDEYISKLEIINEKLKSLQKEMRQNLFEIHTKLSRNFATLRLQARLLMSNQGSALLQERQKNVTHVTRS